MIKLMHRACCFQILNITVGSSRGAPRRGPVRIIFAVRGAQGFLHGVEVSERLRNLSVVEFSFYLGYPVLQVAEREYLNPACKETLNSSRMQIRAKGCLRSKLSHPCVNNLKEQTYLYR